LDNLSASSSSDEGLDLAGVSGSFAVVGTGGTINTNGVGAIVIDGNPSLNINSLTFQSVSAQNTATGIFIQDTTGSFTINGTGATNGSGGTIQDITQRGASFINTQNITLENVIFDDASTTDDVGCTNLSNTSCHAAIHFQNVTGATLDNVDISDSEEQGINALTLSGFNLLNSTITECGTDVNEGCLRAVNLTGASSIQNSDLSFAHERVVQILNTNANLNLTVTGSTFRDTQASIDGADGLELDLNGTSNVTAVISGNTFLRDRTSAVQVVARDTATVDVDIKNNSVDVDGGIGKGYEFGAEDSADLDFEISDNPTIISGGGDAILVTAFNTSSLDGRINNNTNINLNGQAGAGIEISVEDDSTGVVEINNNTITGQIDQTLAVGGIQLRSVLGTGRLDATVNNNTAVMPNGTTIAGVLIQPTDNNIVCANVTNNAITPGVGTNNVGFAIANSSTQAVQLQGFTTDATTTWNNSGNTPVGSVVAGGAVTGGTCSTPTVMVLPTEKMEYAQVDEIEPVQVNDQLAMNNQ
jgi:hypothetical protein